MAATEISVKKAGLRGERVRLHRLAHQRRQSAPTRPPRVHLEAELLKRHATRVLISPVTRRARSSSLASSLTNDPAIYGEARIQKCVTHRLYGKHLMRKYGWKEDDRVIVRGNVDEGTWIASRSQ
jgi:hypothetical protein